MAEQIISASGVQYGLVVDQFGNLRSTSYNSTGSEFAVVSNPAKIQIYNTPYNGSPVGPINVDKSNHALIQVEHEINKINNGSHYFIKGWQNIASSGVPLNFTVTTPNTSEWVHLRFEVSSTDLIELKEYEGATISGGTTVPVYNNNRNCDKTPDFIVKVNPVISGSTPTSGTLLATHRFGIAGQNPQQRGIAGGAGRNTKLILKSGTTYFWEFKPGANNVILDWTVNLYEHSDYVKF